MQSSWKIYQQTWKPGVRVNLDFLMSILILQLWTEMKKLYQRAERSLVIEELKYVRMHSTLGY